MDTIPVIAWTKSSRCSADQPSCVEVAAIEGTVLVRDSKNPDPAGVLMFSREEWEAFREGAKRGDFDRI